MFWFAGAVLGGGACVWRRDKPGSGFRSNSGTHVLAAARLGAAKGPPFLETLPVRTRPACGVIALPCLQLIPMPSEFCKSFASGRRAAPLPGGRRTLRCERFQVTFPSSLPGLALSQVESVPNPTLSRSGDWSAARKGIRAAQLELARGSPMQYDQRLGADHYET